MFGVIAFLHTIFKIAYKFEKEQVSFLQIYRINSVFAQIFAGQYKDLPTLKMFISNNAFKCIHGINYSPILSFMWKHYHKETLWSFNVVYPKKESLHKALSYAVSSSSFLQTFLSIITSKQ